MSSLLVFHSINKSILCCEPSRNDISQKPVVCSLMGCDPSLYTALIVDGSYTTRAANKWLYITEDGLAENKSSMSISVDKTEITADNTDKATISSCPEGAEVFIGTDSEGLVGIDGLVEIVSAVPKVIKITVVLYPWLDWEVTINAS